MKKVKFAVISVIVVLSIVAGLSVLHITNKNKTQDVFEGTDIAVGVDEYIKTQKKEKAPDADNIIFLTENKDVPFDTENKEFQKAVKKIKESFFDTVYLVSDYYSAKKESNGDTKAVIEYLKAFGEENDGEFTVFCLHVCIWER